MKHSGGRRHGSYGGKGGGGSPTMNAAATRTRGTDERGAETAEAVRGGSGANGTIRGHGVNGGEGATAAVLEGVPREEAWRGPALLVGVDCINLYGRRRSGGRRSERGGERTMKTTLGRKRTKLAGCDDRGGGGRGGDVRATTDTIMGKVLDKTQGEGSLLAGDGSKTGAALGVSDVTIAAEGRSTAG